MHAYAWSLSQKPSPRVDQLSHQISLALSVQCEFLDSAQDVRVAAHLPHTPTLDQEVDSVWTGMKRRPCDS